MIGVSAGRGTAIRATSREGGAKSEGHIDLGAGNAAPGRVLGRAATIAVEAMTFLKPVPDGDEVSFYGTIVGSSRTSMKILIEAWRRPREGDEMAKVTSAVFTFVAIGEDRRPRELPAQ